MSKIIFPKEIIDNTVEVYHTKISTKTKSIYWIILAFVIILFFSLFIIQVNVSKQSRGAIRSHFENSTIQTTVSGEIAYLNMNENLVVSKGDTLLKLKTSILNEQQRLYVNKINQNKQFISDLNLMLENKIPSYTSRYISEYEKLNARKIELKNNVDYLKKQYKVDSKLYQKNIISNYEYEKTKNSYENSVKQLNSVVKEFISNWQLEKTKLLIENKEYESSINQIEKEKEHYIITAPANGVLLQVLGLNTGNFISPAQQLAIISINDSLVAECYISPMDIGYIQIGQIVNFQFDTFNYREWGMIKGKVDEIIYDALLSDGQPVFRVRCSLDKNTLYLKNGYSGKIQKGMSFTARFYVAERSLWQMLFDKLDNWLNPTNLTSEDYSSIKNRK